MSYAILIPAYNPNQELLKLAKMLQEENLTPLFVIDDGSHPDTKHIFKDMASQLPHDSLTLLEHATNLGKGAALKYGLNHIYTRHPHITHIITADADGQHQVKDIKKLISHKDGKELVLGVRSFDTKVPLRSKFGNVMTRKITHFFTGVRIEDTQTGLRSIPRDLIPHLLRLQTTRYDFEFDMLLQSIQAGFRLKEIPIQTIYLNENKSSHFNPLLDSMKIYFVLLRFIGSSLVTSSIDFVVFSCTLFLSGSMAKAQFMARLVAGTFNYNVNKRAVFRSQGSHPLFSPLNYILLVMMHAFVSYFLILLIKPHLPVLLAKGLVETGLFFASFFIQRFFIFGTRDVVKDV